jgi:hypothetical protein
MVRRVVVLTVMIAACGKASNTSQTLADCDPAKPLTEARALAWFRASGNQKHGGVTMTAEDVHLHEVGQGIYELGGAPCCDIPYIGVAEFFRCKVYIDDFTEPIRELLRSRGWATADAAKRVELAKQIDPLLGDSLATPPKTWDPHKSFTPPAGEAQPDCSVKLKRWVHEMNCGGQGCAPTFELREITFARDTSYTSSTLEEYNEHEHGYPDPVALASCDPAKPPTKAYADALYVEQGGDQAKLDKVVSRELGHDTWAIDDPRFASTHSFLFVRHCKHAYDINELIPDILLDAGWAKADGPARQKIVQDVDAMMHTTVATQPADWDSKHAFTPPALTSNPDGSVTYHRWSQKRPEESNIRGDDWKYSLDDLEYDPKNRSVSGKHYEHYK